MSAAIQGALSGLRATQAGIDVVSQNVSNSGTAGYTRRTLATVQQLSGNQTTGVSVRGAERVLDTLVQKQLRLETAGAAYTGVKASYHASLDAMFDAPGATGSLPDMVGGLSSALSALATNPASYASQAGVISAASGLAASLGALSSQVQGLRQNAEDALGVAVRSANDLLGQISAISKRMMGDPASAGSAALGDERDGLIDRLSQLMDVKVTARANGTVSLATTGGLQLFDGANPASLTFDGRSALGPNSTYSSAPTLRSVGTIKATDPSGRAVDVIASGFIRSGEIAGYLEMRDEVLPQAQMQLDALAAGLASALSDKKIAGSPASSGAASGFDLNLAGLQNGNAVSLTYTVGGATRTATFVRTGNAAAAAAATASGATGIDFSGGMASVASQIGAALGPGLTVSASGSTLRILDDGAAGTTDVLALSATTTISGLVSGGPELPLFLDGGSIYTGSFERGSQLTGFASRIAVNPAVKSDFGALVAYTATTPAGDPTRPEHLLDALRGRAMAVPASAGIGGGGYSGSVEDFASQIVAAQAAGAVTARSFNEGQQVVLHAIQSRFSDLSGVNIDTEMTQLIQLQTAYGANARVMSAAKEMLDMLMTVAR